MQIRCPGGGLMTPRPARWHVVLRQPAQRLAQHGGRHCVWVPECGDASPILPVALPLSPLTWLSPPQVPK